MARPKRGTGLSADPDEARQQILAAAERVILRYGVPKTTMDDIGKEAGVSRPTVYRYFGDRDALLGALIDDDPRMLFERARTFILGHETFVEQLVEGLVYLVDHGRKDPIVRVLVSPEHMELVTPIVGGIEPGHRTDRRNVGTHPAPRRRARRDPGRSGHVGDCRVARAGPVHPGRPARLRKGR